MATRTTVETRPIFGVSAAILLILEVTIIAPTTQAQDQFDIDVCNANVDEWARDQCLKGLGINPKKPVAEPATESWAKIAEDNYVDAAYGCKKRIERLAQYDFEWTDGWLGAKFSHHVQGDKPGHIIYMGDAIKLQNGFGAWQQYLYSCEFNTRTKTVVDVKAAPGRLD